jgi:hypothetical protein
MGRFCLKMNYDIDFFFIDEITKRLKTHSHKNLNPVIMSNPDDFGISTVEQEFPNNIGISFFFYK